MAGHPPCAATPAASEPELHYPPTFAPTTGGEEEEDAESFHSAHQFDPLQNGCSQMKSKSWKNRQVKERNEITVAVALHSSITSQSEVVTSEEPVLLTYSNC